MSMVHSPSKYYDHNMKNLDKCFLDVLVKKQFYVTHFFGRIVWKDKGFSAYALFNIVFIFR